MPGFRRTLATLLIGGATLLAATAASAESNVLFIFDASGSMKKEAGGETRMAAAKRAMGEALKGMPQGVRLGLLMYGHRRARDCSDIELVAPIGADDAAKISATIANVQPKGETPIAAALQQAARNFASLKGQSNSIVLVTDGIEECQGDPCAAASAVKQAGLDVKVHIVGFTLTPQQRKAIECIATETGGRYFDAKDARALTGALAEVRQQVAQTPPPAPPKPVERNLLHKDHGGMLVAAPLAEWERTIALPEPPPGDKEAIYTHALPSEAIYAFKDGSRAELERFAVYIPKTYGRNLKEFELLVSDSLAEPFRAVGRFTTQNLRVIKSPYQEFKLPDGTAARFLKFRALSTHGETPLYVYGLQAFGKLVDGTAQPAAKPGPKPGQVDVLAKAQGGRLVAAPFAEWDNVIAADGATGTKESTYTHGLPSTAIFGFRDGRAATFDTFAVLVPQTYGRNVKTFEIAAADEVGGPFRALGRFETQNVRFQASPYQEFAFPETTARFVRVSLVNTHGETPLYIYPMRLYGKLAEGPAPEAAKPGPKPGQINLIAKANGGSLVAAPFAEWEGVIAQPETFTEAKNVAYTHGLPSEAVFAFRDGRAATFDKVAVLVAHSYARNVKDFEVLAGDAADGPFRSLGRFSTQNLRFQESPYQEFAFPETTARFVKLRLIDTHGETPLYLYPVKLFGKLADGPAPAAAAAAPAPGQIDILAQANGGQLLAAPDASWEYLNSGAKGADKYLYTHKLPLELVYAFKDEKAATFDTLGVLIPSTYGRNPNAVEVLAGDDLTGDFRSLGRFEIKNVRLIQTPFQEIKLPPTTAKYVKLRFLGTHGETPLYLYQLQLRGKPG